MYNRIAKYQASTCSSIFITATTTKTSTAVARLGERSRQHRSG